MCGAREKGIEHRHTVHWNEFIYEAHMFHVPTADRLRSVQCSRFSLNAQIIMLELKQVEGHAWYEYALQSADTEKSYNWNI